MKERETGKISRDGKREGWWKKSVRDEKERDSGIEAGAEDR